VSNKEEAQFYLGKVSIRLSLWDEWPVDAGYMQILCADYVLQRLAYVYKAKREIKGSKIRVIWGYVCPPQSPTLDAYTVHLTVA
jgi:hypothetical protein